MRALVGWSAGGGERAVTSSRVSSGPLSVVPGDHDDPVPSG
ncbi:hypothetical protein [Streptosporangium sp. NPDC003464]